ncbi:hypothetical protein B0H10DRAFT_2130735 [Mycena sp. CBHHK59/15]|nr:hypothetical protein B0H10DRAFT_2130735 [Mycena sp. CBHHK59/15]
MPLCLGVYRRSRIWGAAPTRCTSMPVPRFLLSSPLPGEREEQAQTKLFMTSPHPTPNPSGGGGSNESVNGALNGPLMAVSPPYYRAHASRRRKTTIALPVPVPSLSKKSRGRRVPTNASTSGEERPFVCKVEGCGKCFVRGEHLKRHVISIHTYEKVHRCTYEDCGKAFSRRDNLVQHSRVHPTSG